MPTPLPLALIVFPSYSWPFDTVTAPRRRLPSLNNGICHRLKLYAAATRAQALPTPSLCPSPPSPLVPS